MSLKKSSYTRRSLKVRSRIRAVSKHPRLSVYRSNLHIWVQIIDDTLGKTLLSASDIKLNQGTKLEKARLVGQEIAKQALKAGIKQVVFDRGAYRFHGRVKAIAESAKEVGLII